MRKHQLHSHTVRSTCILLGLLFGLHGTSTAVEDVPTAEQIEFFESKVRPLLVQRCYKCHAGDENNGGLTVDSRDGLRRGGDSGPALKPGDPKMSLLIEAIRYQNQDLKMPPKNRLPATEVAVLERWIAMGAPDPRIATAESATKPTGMSIEEGRAFWSFLPVADPRVPAVQQTDWVRTPIDAFILAELESQGLTPAPPADKRSLIRRVTFDLVGLPPTVEEVDSFLTDNSTLAFQRVIDRLLQSPQYGVRWGRHWLDVARYADSNGLDENLAFGNAWRYRDYVVDAFNDDKPFDQFLIEQLAGDLLPMATLETKTATGFLVLGAKVLAEPDREKLEMDTIDEQLDTIGKVFLGMTIGCVRCHDHKFDPLKQTDYYALATILKSTKTFDDTMTGVIKHWNEHEFPNEEQRLELKRIKEEIAKRNSAASTFKSQATTKLRGVVRSKAAEYLVAATLFAADAPLTVVAQAAAPQSLHPRVLHHCRLHLKYNKDAPFFSKWHELSGNDKAAEEIRKHYAPLFDEVETTLTEHKKSDPKSTTLDDPRLEEARKALTDSSGFLAIPPKPEFAFDQATLEEYYQLMEAARVYESNAADVPAIMGVTDATVLTSLPIHIRGSHLNLGESVRREFPEVMRTSRVRPIFSNQQSGRLELARWMASTQHPLTARVYANRIWRWHFGAGIVRTTENFGRLGDRPTHAKLLDWLARNIMENGWSTKQLHRLILQSSVYQMDSSHPSPQLGEETDPADRWLWKFPLQRLESEQIRDSILAVSGQLDTTLGGKTVPLRNRQFVFNHTSVDHTKYDSLRRALYLPVIRNNVYTLFEQFDFPDPTMPTGSRNSTVVAPQALLLLNSELVMDAADLFARRLLHEKPDDAIRVSSAYEWAYARPPSQVELRRAFSFIESLTANARTYGGSVTSNAQQQAWSLFCQTLIASNEFIYLR
jgi:hypothetical protein